MRRVVALTALALGVLAPHAMAAGLRLTPAVGARFPERAYVLTLPTKVLLNPAQVSITENGAPVSGLSVQPSGAVRQGSFGTVLVIDASDSMHGSTIDAAMGAARTFARYRNAGQPLAVIMFDSTVATVLPLTSDSTAIERALAAPPRLHPGAHIVSAVSAGVQMLARAHVIAGAIILLSDGAQSGLLSPQASKRRTTQVISAAVAGNVRIYAVGVHDSAFNGASLRNLATAAGGSYTAVNSAGLTSLFGQLGSELSNQYLIRYRSLAAPSINVRVAARVAGQPGTAIASYSAPAIAVPSSGGPSSSFWQTTWAAVLACVVAGALIGLATALVLSPRRSVTQRVGGFVSTQSPSTSRSWTASLLERTFTDDRRGAARSRRWARFVEQIELARIEISPGQIIALTAVATLLAGLLASTSSILLGVALALCVPLAVRFVIHVRVERERRAFEEQLPDNLQVIASAMRAGHTFVGALAVVAEDAPEPSRRELRRVLADEALGLSLADALSSVTARMNSRDFEHVALVAGLQRETGGNTAEVIDNLTEVIRERLDLRRLVRTLTAQGRMSAWVVTALPIVLLVFISLVDPHYLHPLFHRPAGVIALTIGALMLLAGFWTMRRIVDIEV